MTASKDIVNIRPYRNRSINELVQLWHATRNRIDAVIAADELMLRLHLGEITACDSQDCGGLRITDDER